MKNVRSVAAVSMAILILGLTAIGCFAAQANTVYSDLITAAPDTEIEVPVYIAGNTGLMGFALEFEYEGAKITPVSVKRGEVLASGMFDDSIGTGTEDSFKVIWSGTSDMKEDGELFTVTFAVGDIPAQDVIIRITASAKDTFNEKWQEVRLDCMDVTVGVTGEGAELSEEQIALIKEILGYFKKVFDMMISSLEGR
ncbi:MAG: hypothetical protein K6G90_00405 [Clostridia bacterium]|nr:hypothetical protein [Clostridia bacterium]